MKPGMIVVPDQIIDNTSGRVSTFFDGDEVLHIDFTEPFCGEMRTCLLDAVRKTGAPYTDKATYVCVNGPRLETAAEIRTFAGWGADVVGMTAMPEAALAREAGLCYAGISVITNHAAGISGDKLTATEVKKTMADSEENLQKLLGLFFGLPFGPRTCSCGAALDQARM